MSSHHPQVKKGTILYKVLWQGYPPEIATWEMACDIHDDFIDDYEAELQAEAYLDADEEESELFEDEEAEAAAA